MNYLPILIVVVCLGSLLFTTHGTNQFKRKEGIHKMHNGSMKEVEVRNEVFNSDNRFDLKTQLGMNQC
jgi:hypothetical protein